MTTDVYAAKYVPLGYRTPNPDETDARRIAQDLKNADRGSNPDCRPCYGRAR